MAVSWAHKPGWVWLSQLSSLTLCWADRKAFVFIVLDTNHFYFLPPSKLISLIILKPIFSTLYISHRVKYSQCCGLFLCSASTQLQYVTISSQESLLWRSLSGFCYHCVFSLPLTPVQGSCKLRTRFLLNSCSHGPLVGCFLNYVLETERQSGPLCGKLLRCLCV